MKKTMKKILCSLLIVVMCMTSVPLQGFVGLELPEWNWKASAAIYNGECGGYGDNLTYEYDTETGVLTISGSEAMGIYYDGYSPHHAPWYNYRSSIKYVVLPDGLTSIGQEAFEGCTSLTSVTIPDSVTSIGQYAFYGCTSLTSITIPDSVTSVEEYAFYDCTSLTSITIPDSVTSISGSVFYNTAYYNDSSNWQNDVLYIDNHLIKAKESLSGAYVIKEGTKNIANYAFIDCKSLESITIPTGVTSIGNRSFEQCSSLTEIVIPNGVTTIGWQAFYKCYNLVNISIPDSVRKIGSNAFTLKAGSSYTDGRTTYIGKHLIGTSVDVPSEYRIKDNTLTIADRAFLQRNIKSIIIPNSVVTIGDSAFFDCNNLINIIIPDSVISIGSQAFNSCYNLTDVTIGNGVTIIGLGAFSECYNLTSVTIGNSVTTIGTRAFESCNQLTTISIPDSVTSINFGAFNGCHLENITLPDSITSISRCVFEECHYLTSITIPDSITSIGDEAFYRCTSLKDVYYSGTEEQWNKISIGSDNECLINATIHYNPIGPNDDPNNGENDTGNTITPDYIKKNYFTQQHLDFVANKNSNFYALATDDFRFAGELWENAEGGFGQIAAEFAYDVLEGTLEVIFLQFFDGIDCLENPYDAILLDFLASGSTTESFKNILENDMGVICVKIINDLLKICQSDADWVKDMDILSEIESLITVSDYSENKLYKVLEQMLKGKGTGFVDGIFKTFECFGKVSDVLNVGLSAVDYFVEMMKYTAAIEAYYNSTVSYKKFLSELADEVEAVTIYGNAGEKFREAYENYASCVNYANVTENIIEYRKEKGKTFIQSLAQGVLSKTTLTVVAKIFGLSKVAAIKFNAALWAADAGFAISNMLTGNDTIVNCREILRANHILDVASYNIMKDYEIGLKKQESYLYAEKFDYAFNFYKNVQLYSLNVYKKHCEASSTKPLSFRKKHFKNELEATVGRINIWNNPYMVCHTDFDTELVTAGMLGVHTAVIACPTDIYVYRKSDDKLVACVINNISKQYSDEVSIICVGEEKALACESIDDYRVEIVATGNGTMDVIYNEYINFANKKSIEFEDFKISKDKTYELQSDKKSLKNNDGIEYSEDGKISGCSCKCHKNGIAKFFFKFILFFQKIFKTNKTCSCGVNHY